jgi:hypothetical protein
MSLFVIHSDIGPLALDWISIVRGRLEHADKLVESDGEEQLLSLFQALRLCLQLDT